jgi:hypothetical protein
MWRILVGLLVGLTGEVTGCLNGIVPIDGSIRGDSVLSTEESRRVVVVVCCVYLHTNAHLRSAPTCQCTKITETPYINT